ncbi:hypothetical protein L3Q82_023398, partial [Scortum barcoo]
GRLGTGAEGKVHFSAGRMTSLQLSAEEEMVERFLDAAARGDQSQVSTLLTNVPSLLNQTGYSGWTALMLLAARNGHYHTVEALLSHGCDKFSVNSSSQTAYDIAKFWGHRHISDLLGRTDDGSRRVLTGSDLPQQENYFSRETLDRLSGKRTEKVWLEAKQSDPDTVYLLFSNLYPMVSSSQQDDSAGGETKLCRFRYEAIKDLFQKPATVLIFLGVEKRKKPFSSSTSSSSQTDVGVQEPPAWFAIGTDEDAAELLKRCREKNCSFPKTPNRDLLKLSEEEAGERLVAGSLPTGPGRAQPEMAMWARLPVGSPPAGSAGGELLTSTGDIVGRWKKYFEDLLNPTDLPSNEEAEAGDSEVDSSITQAEVTEVVRVVAQARSVLAWHGRYSFCPTCGSSTKVEEAGYKRSCLNSDCRSLKGVHNTCLSTSRAGESLEEAVRREVEEESGVKVGPVQYVSCQPWPMPSSLMIGCLAVAISTDIKVDENEIEGARWFPRQQVIDSLFRGDRMALTVPPRQTIAHQLIRHWIGMTSNL